MFARFSKRRPRRKARGGFVLLTAAVLFLVVIPVAGLAIDVGMLYMAQSKLSAAIDAAALAGARSLSRGNDGPTQQQNAAATVQAYLAANFPAGYLNLPAPTINTLSVSTQANYRTVTIAASVPVPRLFLGLFGSSPTVVNASATATRRDVNVMIVLDRSGSLALSGSCAPLKAAATAFVNKFANGRDNMGLITFATSSRVDFPLNSNFQTANPNVITTINNVTCTGATSSAQALWQGYQALAALNQPAALNVILFFTDGQPTAVTAVLPMKPTSVCNGGNPVTGVFTVGFRSVAPYDPLRTGGVMAYNAPPQPFSPDNTLVPNSTGCVFATNWPSFWTWAANDIAYVPTTDIWGNNLNNGYQPVTLSGGGVDITSNAAGALNMINASTNAADDAANRIRNAADPGNGAPALSNVVIFSIGLGNATYPPNGDLLRRVANDPASSCFTATAPTGLYVNAPTAADLNNAFIKVASQILRLAQ